MATIATTDLRELRARCAGPVHLPGDAGWDAARQAWNLAVDQRPAAVVHPESADDVVATVRAARAAGLRVAPQGTGHNAGPLGDLSETILLKTSLMREVSVDGPGRRARVGAGVLWEDVVGPAAEHGLAVLSGSSPDVGVVGYSLGGGIGWMARELGMQTNSVLAAELVTADGELVRVDADHEPELFWAIRGGGGSFGVVTALEFALYPVAEVHAGCLAWDWEHAAPVIERWVEWAAAAPDAVTTSMRILQMPPLPEVPDPIRGRNLVMIDGASTAGAAGTEEILRPLRELRPELDMFGPMPPAALIHVHGDPPEPVPAASDHALVGALDAGGVEAFVATAGPGSGSRLMMAELRQLGGALGRPAAGAGALPMLDADYALFAGGMAATPEMEAAALEDAGRLVQAMGPWVNGRTYLNFAEQAVDARTAYAGDVHARLRVIREQVDPDGLLHANHPIG